MKKCSVCSKVIIAGGTGDQGQYCSKKCQEMSIRLQQGFCNSCLEETTDESPGNVQTVNGIGTALQGGRWGLKGIKPCPTCGSVIQTKWFTIGFGIKPLGTYRVIYLKHGFTRSQFIGRKLKNDPVLTQTSPYASLGARAVALVIDSLILGLAMGILSGLFIPAMRTPKTAWIFPALAVAISWIYFALQESSARQATLGKKIMKIRVVDPDSPNISFAKASLRFLIKAVAMLPYGLGLLVAVFTKKKQGIHDLICKTVVING